MNYRFQYLDQCCCPPDGAYLRAFVAARYLVGGTMDDLLRVAVAVSLRSPALGMGNLSGLSVATSVNNVGAQWV